MKIEGYLYIPYQGQLRFRYDDQSDSINRFYKSDRDYDIVLGVPPFTRDGPCREFVHANLWRSEWEPKLMALISAKVAAKLKKSLKGTVFKENLGTVPGASEKNNQIWCAFTLA